MTKPDWIQSIAPTTVDFTVVTSNMTEYELTVKSVYWHAYAAKMAPRRGCKLW